VLSYSTYLGGGVGDTGFGIAVDALGNVFVTGQTGSTDFPTTPGAFQTMGGGGFVTKLNSTGSDLVYSTYLGPSRGGFGIAVDAEGNVYVTGATGSVNFPVTEGAFQTTFRGGPFLGDAFVAKLNPEGSGLIYSSYLGGSGDEGGLGIAVDNDGNAYIAGGTSSTNFPTTEGAFQPAFGGGPYDAFVTKVNANGSALVYSTYLGGNNWETPPPNFCFAGICAGFGGIAVDESGSAYVTGFTGSSNFPITPGAFQTSLSGTVNAFDAFVTKLNADGSGLVYSTYLGGSNVDVGNGIKVDASGNAYVTGFTASADFPTTPEAFDMTCGTDGQCDSVFGSPIEDVFVTKLNADGNALTYSTYLGGRGNDFGFDIAVDSSGNAYVTGSTRSNDFPLANPFQDVNRGGADVFIVKVNADGSTLSYSSFLGGTADSGLVIGSDVGLSIAVDASGNAYVTGSTFSPDFPTTPGAFQESKGGIVNDDAFVAKISLIADLAITKTDSLDPVTVGSLLTYSLTVTNSGPDGTTGVTVTDTLPAEVTFVSATPTQGNCTEAGGVVTCDLGELAADASATVEIIVTTMVAGEIINIVMVTANEPDPNPGNNGAAENTTVNPAPGADVTAMGR
jgi:uncharacterized repeat protein (TIGR01451 family)